MGPSLEFYALVAAELQRKGLGMWICDDVTVDETAREVRIPLQKVVLSTETVRYNFFALELAKNFKVNK